MLYPFQPTSWLSNDPITTLCRSVVHHRGPLLAESAAAEPPFDPGWLMLVDQTSMFEPIRRHHAAKAGPYMTKDGSGGAIREG